ncbi:hypothetical protein [Streptomyces pseudogriseolus]|uniref:hypothetical protein n=1 Tax=Streptomyces pseudogriseolus TaxID=36817 RepID=UPI003FA33360
MIQQIVAAVREGDDARIHVLLQDFAREADLSAALALRRQLYRDLGADQGPARPFRRSWWCDSWVGARPGGLLVALVTTGATMISRGGLRGRPAVRFCGRTDG